MSPHSRVKCMKCTKPPTIEVLWAEGMAYCFFCDAHFNDWANTNKNDICSTRKLKYGVASKEWSDGVPTKEEAQRILLQKQLDDFIIKYKNGVQMGIPTKVTTSRGNYNALRYKKVPIEDLIVKSTEKFSLIGSYKSGDNNVTIQSSGDENQVIVNDTKVYDSTSLGDALNRYYHELKNIASSQTEDKDLALTIFGDMVVTQNRKIIPMLNQLGRLSEAQEIEKQWAQFGVVPFNEEKDTDTVVSRAIPAKEFDKKRIDRTEQHPIIGGDVKHPGTASFGMLGDVKKIAGNLISKSGIDNSETIEFKSQDTLNNDGTTTTKYEVKKISPYQPAIEDGESIKNNDSGVFSKQTMPSVIGPSALTPTWIAGFQTMGKIPVRVPIKRQGKVYYGIRWKRPGETGIVYPNLRAREHLIRPEDYLEDSLVHSTLYYGTDKDTAEGVFKHGFKTGELGDFGLAFYLYTNIKKARERGKVIVMVKLDTEEVLLLSKPYSSEKPIQYADILIHFIRKNIGDPKKSTEIGIAWNDEFLRRGIKALAYPLNYESNNKKDYEIEIIAYTSDILKVIANVRKDGNDELKTEDIQKDMGEDITNPDYVNMPKYTYGTSGIPDATIMRKQATFSTKDQIPAELGNNTWPIKHPIGPNLDKQKPIMER